MSVYHVVVMAKNQVIGKDNKLPWHFPCDLKHFKELTTGNTILMGRKTYESIGKPLPKRESFVVSRTRHDNQDHLQYFGSIDEALKAVETEHCYIIGGETIYRQTLNKVDGIYLSHIDQDFDGDCRGSH